MTSWKSEKYSYNIHYCISLDDLTQLSYEDYQNIKKLKDNNKRSKSVPGFKNQNENYTLNFTNGEKLKENIEIERENEIKKIKNDLYSKFN